MLHSVKTRSAHTLVLLWNILEDRDYSSLGRMKQSYEACPLTIQARHETLLLLEYFQGLGILLGKSNLSEIHVATREGQLFSHITHNCRERHWVVGVLEFLLQDLFESIEILLRDAFSRFC